MSTRDRDYYYSSTTEYSHVPDPVNLGKFIEYKYERLSEKVLCVWCKSGYSREKDCCPNCGGPRQ